MDGVHHHLVLLAQDRNAGLEPQLGFGQIEAFPIHRDIVTVGARPQSILEPARHGARPPHSAAPIACFISESKSIPTARYPGVSMLAMFCAVSFAAPAARSRYRAT